MMDSIEGNLTIINFSGKSISLGPLRRDLVSLFNRWNNGFETTRTLATARPVIFDEEVLAFDQLVKSNELIFFTIYEKNTKRPIGNTYLADIDYKHRTAEFNKAGIMAYEKAGFVECGRRRESHFIGGRLWGQIFYGMLVHEF